MNLFGHVITMPQLYDKSGSTSRFSDFAIDIRKVVDENRLPEYVCSLTKNGEGDECIHLIHRSYLSVHDPLYITPVLTGATMLWQQRLMPAAAGTDPTQQKMMMYVLPAVMTFTFMRSPAGVSVYWLMSSLWGIGQQYLTNYLIGPPNIRTARPAAERRVKLVGPGKTEAAARE